MEEVEKRSFHTEKRKYPRFELSRALAFQWGMTKGTLRTIEVSYQLWDVGSHSP